SAGQRKTHFWCRRNWVKWWISGSDAESVRPGHINYQTSEKGGFAEFHFPGRRTDSGPDRCRIHAEPAHRYCRRDRSPAATGRTTARLRSFPDLVSFAPGKSLNQLSTFHLPADRHFPEAYIV